MKPEELDDLFRRGLSEQHAPPRSNAWAAIQQRMTASADGAVGADDDDDLPAFLRTGVPDTAVPAPAPAPFMTAARGGAALRQPAASLTVSWWQRPAVRVAAAVLLLIGGGTVAIQHVEPLHSSPSVAVIAPSSLAPTAQSQPAAPEQAVAVASTETTPVTASAEPAKAVEAQAPTTVAAQVAAVAVPSAETPASAQRTSRAPKAFRPTGGTSTAFASTNAHPNLRVTDALIHDHLLCEVQHCRACDVIEEKIGSSRFRGLRADAAAELVARNNASRRNDATRAADLLTDAVVEVTIRPAADPAAVAVASSTAALVGNRASAETEETVELGSGAVGQLVSRAAGRRQFRVLSPNALLRRASGRVRDLLDRADHTADGQLTIETSLAGRSVVKTISL